MAKLNKSGKTALIVRFQDPTEAYSELAWSSVWGHVELDTVEISEKEYDRGYRTSYLDDRVLQDVKITCEYDSRDEPYAWRVENHSVTDLETAQYAVKVQSAVKKTFDAVRNTYGYDSVSTFGTYVSVVCSALGIARVGFFGYDNHPNGILWLKPADAASKIDNHVRDARNSLNEKVTA